MSRVTDLGRLEHVHDNDGGGEPDNVGNKGHVKVKGAAGLDTAPLQERAGAGLACTQHWARVEGNDRSHIAREPEIGKAERGAPLVKAKQEGNKDARNDNVAQAEHGVLGAKDAVGPKVFGKDDLRKEKKKGRGDALVNDQGAARCEP